MRSTGEQGTGLHPPENSVSAQLRSRRQLSPTRRTIIGHNTIVKSESGAGDPSADGSDHPKSLCLSGDLGAPVDFIIEDIRRILNRVETDFDRDWGCVS